MPASPARIILASGSPRRRELLVALVHDFDIEASDIPEPTTADPVGDALALALDKARAVAEKHRDALVIGSDTIVFDDEQSYGKPVDAADARRMLAHLAGREHRVATGVAVIGQGRALTDADVSEVRLTALSREQISDYVASGRPLDKAGAYAIQDEDVPTVANLDGCFCGVMGLPLWTLRRLLLEFGVECGEPDGMFGRCASCPRRSSAEC